MEQTKQQQQLKAIMDELNLNFDFLNSVLSSRKINDGKQLWYSWGKLYIVTPEDRNKGAKAGDLSELSDWNTEVDGSITLLF